MDRRSFLGVAAGVALPSPWAEADSPAENLSKPNVVICICDQWRSFEVGCYGNPDIRTPNIDKLAENGCRFENSICNNPVCTPSRSSVLSGLYSRSCTGALWNDALESPNVQRDRFPQPTIGELLRDAGYHTGLIGKWHIELDPFLMGFEYALYPVYVQTERNYGWLYRENSRDISKNSQDGAREVLPNGFDPAYASKRVHEYIACHRKEPFFLYYSILQPHMPIGPGNMPQKYIDMYDPHKVPIRKNVYTGPVTPFDEFWFHTYTVWDYFGRNRPDRMANRKGDALPPGFDIRNLTSYYYGAVTCADDQIGELMKALDEHGVAENTIVVICADHGDMLGSHHRYNKNVLYEESIRTPIVVRYPKGFKSLVNRKQVASNIDIMPTVLDMCGLPVPQNIQGKSLVPILRGERESLSDDFRMIETDQYCIGIRTPSHLYGMQLAQNDPLVIADDRLYFFDLKNDPFEMENLAKTSQQSQLAQDLRRRLTEWNQSTPWLKL